MDILRPPPGQQDDEAPPPSRNRFLRFLFAILFLVVGMVVFFIGGVVVRNPQMPNYLLDRIVRHFQGRDARSATAGKGYVSSAENLKPPPTPTTPEQYLNLMSYDENTLPPDERAAASVLNQTVVHLEAASFVRSSPEMAQLFSKQIIPGIAKLQPGGSVTEIRDAIEKCRVKANTIIQFYQELPEDLAQKLIAAGVPDSLAHQTGELFTKRAKSELNISSAAEVNLACNSVTTLVDLLSKNPSKWKRNNDGNVLFTTKTLYDQFNAATQDLNSAIKALNGG
jgi:hypothetical protein